MRPVSVGPDVVLPQAVDDNEHHVGSLFEGRMVAPDVSDALRKVAARRAEQGRTGEPRAGELEEIPA